ncbi:hypothetical protein NEIG_00676 [Nematocida sp. ERTm5]|nr:hypothetical protein NEIG_00676 [Nematocida sp. ERTm5]
MLQYFTVEYDGYTYKKEEEKKEKKPSGSHYLVNMLSLSTENKMELERIINRMNTKSKWKDLSDKQERMYSKMEKVLSKLRAYTPFSVPFLNKVSKREAPEYYNMIQTPMDLGKMGKKLFLQEYSDIAGFTSDLDLIWENCFRFNNTHGNVYAMYAQKMKEKSLVLLQDLFSEREIEIEESPEVLSHFLHSEKWRKEMVATRAAILQNPAEFTQKRTPKGMHEYWKKESEIIRLMQKENLHGDDGTSWILEDLKEKPSFLYLPEYTHFYNSFPITEEDVLSIPPPAEYTLGNIHNRGYERYDKNTSAYKLGEKLSQSHCVHYMNGVYTNDQMEVIPDIEIGRPEVVAILTRIVSLQLLAIGFTATESSALDIIVSHVLNRIQTTICQIRREQTNILNTDCEKSERMNALIKSVIKVFEIRTTEVPSPQFFSEEEEKTDEDSMIDIIYSNAEDADLDEDIL